jgi:hypothetical protein
MKTVRSFLIVFVLFIALFPFNTNAETNRQLNCNDTYLTITVYKGALNDIIQYEWVLDTRLENIDYLEIVERYFLNDVKLQQFYLTYEADQIDDFVSLYWAETLKASDYNAAMEISFSVRTASGNYQFMCDFPTTAIGNLPVRYLHVFNYLPFIKNN